MTADRKISRRQALGMSAAFGAGLAAPALLPRAALAQESADAYPSRDIKIFCAFPAGSGADVLARFYAEGMKPAFPNRSILIENRPGANGNIATIATARSKPDGYTLYIHGISGLAANMHLYKDPGVDAGKTIEVLATVSKLTFTVSVRANAPWKNLKELIAYIREKGDKASYATTAPTGKVPGAMMKVNLGLKALEVPYRTGPDSLNDLASGNIDYAMYDPTFALAQERAGRIRILAVASGERMQCMPDVPTMKEEGAGDINVLGWWGLMAPRGVPDPIKKKLGDAFYAMARAPATKEFLVKAGTDPFILSPEEAQRYFLEEIENWRRYVKIANIEPMG